MEINDKKSAVDLTELAIGIVVLGIVVSVGGVILSTFRDSRLSELTVLTTRNESLTTVGDYPGETIANAWFNQILFVTNQSGTCAIASCAINSANYTTEISGGGKAIIYYSGGKAAGDGGSPNGTNWNVSYEYYNISEVEWKLANDASVGLSEYGNWFTILVVVGIAAVVLSLIFLAFGNKGRGSTINSSSGGGVSF